jgi:hypothetical protein
MRIPRRSQRQVYRVYEEDEFLGRSSPAETERSTEELPSRGPVTARARPAQEPGRARLLAAALIVLAVLAAGGLALDAVDAIRRGRTRSQTNPRPSASAAASDSGRRGRSGRRGLGRRGHSRPGAARSRRLPPRQDDGRVFEPQPVESAPYRPADTVAQPGTGEFSFERRIAP